MTAESERLSLCMIVRDEAEFLPRCLDSVQGVVDEIILVDTGSTDGTPELARRHGARVFSHPWADDFGTARNRSLELASGDWLLVMDADEALHPEDGSRLRTLIKDATAEAFLLEVVNFFGPEARDRYVIDPVCRLFRNRPGYRYKGQVHEDIQGVIRNQAGPDRLIRTSVRILHYGYLDAVRQSRGKGRRNQAILHRALGESPDDPDLLYCLGTEELQAGRPRPALDRFRKAWNLRRDDSGFTPDLIQKIALCHWELGESPQALEALETGTSLYPDFADLHYLQGQILRASGQPWRAVEAYRRAIAIGEAPARYTALYGAGTFLAHHGLGRAYEEVYLHPLAGREYYRSLRANPRFTPALLDLLRTHKELHGTQAVRRLIETRFRVSSPDATLTLCENLVAAGLASLAEPYIAGVTAGEAGDPSRYWLARGTAAFLLRRPQDAVTALARVAVGSKYRPKAALYLLVCYWFRGEWEEARRLLEDPSELSSDGLPLYRALHRFRAPGDKTDAEIMDAAAADLAAAAAIAPEERVLELAGALLALGGADFAAPVLTPLAAGPRATRLAVAELLAAHGEIAGAEEQVRTILRDFGEDGALHRRLSWWLTGQGDWIGAARWLRAALDAAPADLANYLATSQFWQRRAARLLQSLNATEVVEPVARALDCLLPDSAEALDVVEHD